VIFEMTAQHFDLEEFFLDSRLRPRT